MVTAVAKHLDVDPTYLQFFKAQTYRDAPGQALRCTFDGTLKDLLVFCRPKVPKRMFYQQLTIPIHELENKKQMKCIYLSPEQVTITHKISYIILLSLLRRTNNHVFELSEFAKESLFSYWNWEAHSNCL